MLSRLNDLPLPSWPLTIAFFCHFRLSWIAPQVKEGVEGCAKAAGAVTTNDVLSEFDLSKMSSLLKAEYGVDVTEESLKGAARASRLIGGAGKPLSGQDVVVRAKHGESSTLVSAITVDDNDGPASSTAGVGTNAAHTAAAATAATTSSGLGGISLRLLSSDEDESGHSLGNGATPSAAAVGGGGSGIRPFDPTDEHSPTSKKCLEELGLSQSEDDMNVKVPAVENTTKEPSPSEQHVTEKASSAAKKPAAINRKPSPSSKKQATTQKKATPTGKKTATKKTPTKRKTPKKKKSPSKRESSVEVSLSNVMGTFGAHHLLALSSFVCN